MSLSFILRWPYGSTACQISIPEKLAAPPALVISIIPSVTVVIHGPKPMPLTFGAAVVFFHNLATFQKDAKRLGIIVLPEICIRGIFSAWHTSYFDVRPVVPSKRMNHLCPNLICCGLSRTLGLLTGRSLQMKLSALSGSHLLPSIVTAEPLRLIPR